MTNRRGEKTRQRLMDAAAALFAERGLGQVTMTELHAATGQRNKSAIRYHFGSLDGLTMAIVMRRRDRADSIRSEMLDEVADDDLTGLIWALVSPAATNLDAQQGRYYLRIAAQMAQRLDPEERLTGAEGLLRETLDRIEALLGSQDDAVRRARLGAAFSFLIESLSARAARIDSGRADVLASEVFEANLVAMIEGLLTAPAPAPRGHEISVGATGAA